MWDSTKMASGYAPCHLTKIFCGILWNNETSPSSSDSP